MAESTSRLEKASNKVDMDILHLKTSNAEGFSRLEKEGKDLSQCFREHRMPSWTAWMIQAISEF